MTFLHVSTPWLIIIATALSAFSMWVVVSMIGTRGRSLLVSFFVVAGAVSAWVSLRHPQSAWFIFLAALLVAFLLWLLFHKLGKTLQPTTITWSQYLKGQGALLFFFLLIGGGFAWLSVTYGPYPGRVSKGGQLLKFESLDPSQHPVYQEVDVEKYSEISVFTKSESPANGSATVTIYLDHGDTGKLEFGQLESEATAWSRWNQASTGKRMSLVVGAPTQSGAIPATQVDILVYLTPK
jgi:hypothetical protein